MGESRALISVTGVDVAPDIKSAVVWIDILGGNKEDIFKEAESLRPALQRELASRLESKFIPKIALRLDTGGDYADHINRLLKKSR
jgi:ribosome-binding factor A